MRLRHAALTLLVVGLVSASGTWAPQAAGAPDTTPPQILDVRISPAAVSLTGTTSAIVTISVHLSDSSGICTTCRIDGDPMASFNGYALPLVQTSPTPAAPGLFDLTRFDPMTRTSGAVTDGWWTARRAVTGLWNGTHALTRIAAEDTAGNVVDMDPRGGSLARSLSVHAVDRPHISTGPSPPIGPYGSDTVTLKGRVYLEASGQPLGRRVLLLCEDTGCGIDDYGGVQVPADARGYYSVTAKRQTLGLMLFHHLRTAADGTAWPPAGWLSTDPLQASRWPPQLLTYHLLTVRVADRTLTGGQQVRVSGTTERDGYSPGSSPEAYRSAYLQLFTGGRWRVVARTLLGPAVRGVQPFTLTAEPPGRGPWVYRVLRTATPGYAATTYRFGVTVS